MGSAKKYNSCLFRHFEIFAKHNRVRKCPRSCQQKHGILVTADSAYVPLLTLDHKTSWGVLLLSDVESAELDVVRRLFARNLAFRPSVERMAMVITPVAIDYELTCV